MRVFVQPARDKESAKNIRRSLDHKVHRSVIAELPEDERRKVDGALGLGEYRLWSPKPTARNEKTWEQMQIGDLVLIYPNGSPKLRCFPITGKVKSALLGSKVWNGTKEGLPFQHLYALGGEIESDLTLESYNRILGYKANNKIQGFGVHTGPDADLLLGHLVAEDDLAADLTKIQLLEGLTITERTQLLKSRVGQGKFRDSLVERWGGCAVTGIEILSLLRASHIKPWSKSDNLERLSVENGLLLLGNYDQAFDAGFISFDDDRRILVSPRISPDCIGALGLNLNLQLRMLPLGVRPFLKFHREQIFKAEALRKE